MKEKIQSLGSSLEKKWKKIKEDPKKTMLQCRDYLIHIFTHNKLFCTYVLTCVINGMLLRFLTMNTVENYIAIKPIIADAAIVILLGSLVYLFKPKRRIIYLSIMEIFFTAICIINSIYYTFYTSFASISMLSLTQFIAPVGDAVVENVMQIKDLFYLWGPLCLFAMHFHLKKKGYYNLEESVNKKRKRTLKTLIAGSIFMVIFSITLTPLEIGRFANQWNREYIVMKFGIYTYQFNDVIKSVEPKITSIFGFDEAMKEFREYFEGVNQNPKTNAYTNKLKGKNIIAIHAESVQSFAIGLKFNGVEVTPTLNRLVSEGLYFNNFYSQVSVGTSSDTELTLSTSLMPTHSGTAFVSYFDRKYISIQNLLSDMGYYTFSMHGNTADFWNRRLMHQNLGYQKFFSKAYFDVNKNNSIGLGISDKSFFEQAIPYLIDIKNEHQPFYGTFITLTNHTPFSEIEKYDPFDVDLKVLEENELGQLEEVSYPYMEGTKLGNYLKSLHYADAALGQFLEDLEENGLLENTVIMLYGDHDARLPKKDYQRLLNYDKTTNGTLSKEDPNYIEFESYQYELNRRVPLIFWDKDQTLKGTVSNVMGMYDVMPTLGNLMGFYNPYQLGHDIFNIKEDNIVVFPNGNWVTNKGYYNSQKEEYFPLKEDPISENYIKNCNEYANQLLEVSNNMIVFDLIKKDQESKSILEK